MKSVTESGHRLKSVVLVEPGTVFDVLICRHEDDDGQVQDGERDQGDEPPDEEFVDADVVEDPLETKTPVVELGI